MTPSAKHHGAYWRAIFDRVFVFFFTLLIFVLPLKQKD
jgi:hypothetical protein